MMIEPFELLDLFGTFIFGLSGAFRAVKYELDILGVLILAIVTGVGGGLVRDALMGATPAAALQNENYLIVTIVAGLLVFFWANYLARQWRNVAVLAWRRAHVERIVFRACVPKRGMVGAEADLL